MATIMMRMIVYSSKSTVVIVNDQDDHENDEDDDQNGNQDNDENDENDYLLFKVDGATVVLIHLTDHLFQLLFVIFCQFHHHHQQHHHHNRSSY